MKIRGPHSVHNCENRKKKYEDFPQRVDACLREKSRVESRSGACLLEREKQGREEIVKRKKTAEGKLVW